MCVVVALCYQLPQQGAKTPHDKSKAIKMNPNNRVRCAMLKKFYVGQSTLLKIVYS